MRSGREPTKLPAHENISISISVNLRKQADAKKVSLVQDNLLSQRDRPITKRQALADTTKPTKGKATQEPRPSATQQLTGSTARIPKSHRTFSEAQETVRMKTGETAATKTKKVKPSSTQLKKKSEPRKKPLSNEMGKGRKYSGFVNKSVENLNRPRYNKSLSRTPLKSSKSKSKECQSLSKSSGRKVKRKTRKLEIEDKYINTFENDPKKIPQSHRLPHEEMEHMVSRYKNEPRVKHSVSIEPVAGANKKKGHKKNQTLVEKAPKVKRTKAKESQQPFKPKEANVSKSAKNSFIFTSLQPKEEPKEGIKIQVNRKPLRTSITKLQCAILSYLARRHIQVWKKQQESPEQLAPNEGSMDQVHITGYQERDTFHFVDRSLSSQNSLKTVENFDGLEVPELLKMIQGLSKQSKGQPLEKQLSKIVEEAKKRQHQHQQILRENEQLRAMIQTSRRGSTMEEDEQSERKKQLESLKNFKQEFGSRFNRISSKTIQLDIERIQADNEEKMKMIGQTKVAVVEKPQVTTPVAIGGITSPRNLMSLLREKQRILGDKHQKEVEVLSIMLQKQLVSPKTYKTKLTALDVLIEQERTGLERSKREAQRITRLVRTIRNDKQEIDRLDNVCKKQLWSDAKELVMDIAISKQSTKPLYETEPAQLSTPIDRSRVDKIFNTFDNDIEEGEPKPLSLSNDHIQIINMQEQYHRQQPTQQTQHTQTDQNTSVNQLPPFKTDIYFIKEYCTSLCQHILEDTYLRVIFLANVQTPLKYDKLEFLQWYRLNTQHQPTRCYNIFKQELLYPYYKVEAHQRHQKAISNQMFAQFNAGFEQLRLNDLDANKTTIELQQIFLQAILDALNQSFNMERPCADQGQPQPWCRTYLRPRHHGINTLEEEEYLILCARAINRLIDWATFYCGTITEHVTYENSKISQQQQQKIRDTRLTLMMERTIEQNERVLLGCQEQLTEVSLELGQALLDHLLLEFARERFK